MERKMYINGASAISIQKPLTDEGIFNPIKSDGKFVKCQEPDYKEFIAPLAARRMSPIVKRAIATSMRALKEAKVDVPDAIINGTGIGCFEDTDGFITGMLDNHETLLKPTMFINSTPNTVSSQVAIKLRCHGYNNTHVHNGAAFEGALLDGWMQLQNGDMQSVLLGAGDESNDDLFKILGRLGCWNFAFCSEGSVSFVMSANKSASSYCSVDSVESYYVSDKYSKEAKEKIRRERMAEFLSRHGLTFEDIDVVFTGEDGDPAIAEMYDFIPSGVLRGVYKKLCGEYFTASAYGFYVVANVLKHNLLPAHLSSVEKEMSGIKRVLFVDAWMGRSYTFALMSRV
jgi:3-oxoacyl-[acyl-carrier-protein] synthase II